MTDLEESLRPFTEWALSPSLPESLFHGMKRLPISWRVLDRLYGSGTTVSPNVHTTIVELLGATPRLSGDRRFIELLNISDGKSEDPTAPFVW